MDFKIIPGAFFGSPSHTQDENKEQQRKESGITRVIADYHALKKRENRKPSHTQEHCVNEGRDTTEENQWQRAKRHDRVNPSNHAIHTHATKQNILHWWPSRYRFTVFVSIHMVPSNDFRLRVNSLVQDSDWVCFPSEGSPFEGGCQQVNRILTIFQRKWLIKNGQAPEGVCQMVLIVG